MEFRRRTPRHCRVKLAITQRRHWGFHLPVSEACRRSGAVVVLSLSSTGILDCAVHFRFPCARAENHFSASKRISTLLGES